MNKLLSTLTTLVLLMAALVTNAQTSGKLEGNGATMTYSISGGTVIKQGDSHPGWQRGITCEVTPGTTVTFHAEGSGKKAYDDSPCKVNASISANTSKNRIEGKSLFFKQEKGRSVSFSYTVPEEAGSVNISADYTTRTKLPLMINVNFQVVKGKPAPKPEPKPEQKPEPKPQPKPEPKPESKEGPKPEVEEVVCNCNQRIDSHIRFNDFYGEVKIRPNCWEDDSYEFVDLDTEIYECDRIKTEEESGAILGLEDMSTYVIKPESILIIYTKEEKTSKIAMILGTMWSNIKKMAEDKTLEVEMSQIAMSIEGTIFACEETGKESKVWLFAGKVTVTNKKTGKKTVLQPGQTITCKGSTSEVKSFNIEQGAKKFDIPMSDINNHYSNNSNSSGKKVISPESNKEKKTITNNSKKTNQSKGKTKKISVKKK